MHRTLKGRPIGLVPLSNDREGSRVADANGVVQLLGIRSANARVVFLKAATETVSPVSCGYEE